MAPGDLLVAQKSFIYQKMSKKLVNTCEKSQSWLVLCAIYRARKLSQLAHFMDLVILRTFFTVSVIPERPEGP